MASTSQPAASRPRGRRWLRWLRRTAYVLVGALLLFVFGFLPWFLGTRVTTGRFAYNDRENALPFDQHMLIALAAPRAVYVASGSADLWADPRGEYLALAAASGVYALWGHPPIDPGQMPPTDTPVHAPLRGYHIHEGPHDLGRYDWMAFADFADRLWQRGAAAAHP